MSTILIVDDQPVNRQMLSTLLGYHGHRIVEAADGAEALGVARREHPALVISDIVMPTMDGYEFVRQLRRDGRFTRLPVVFYTANYFEREARGLAAACGVRHVLTKPAEPEVILQTVRDALAMGPPTVSAPPVDAGFDREHVRLMTDKLSAKVDELEAAKHRLQRLVKIGQQLNRRRDVESLLTEFCRAGRDLLAAGAATVGLADAAGEQFPRVVADGEGWQAEGLQVPLAIPATPLGLPIQHRAPVRDRIERRPMTATADSATSGFKFFLGVPLWSDDRVIGCLCFCRDLTNGPFSDEDEQLAVSLAGQLSVAYENVVRLETIEQQNAELERRIAERTIELQRSNEELEQFAYVASHDLQEPLRIVSSFTQLLGQRYRGRLDADADEFIGYIVDGTGRMKTLISDLLAYSRVNSQGATVTAVAAGPPLQSALSDLAPLITAAGAVVTADPLPTVLADEVQLGLVFQNLIGNAIKFRGPEPPAVHVGAERQGAEYVFSVRDNGIGIDPEFADRIFIMFQRLHSRADYDGTGIGLAICKRIVSRLGGRIWVDSRPGAGATFFFTLRPAGEQP